MSEKKRFDFSGPNRTVIFPALAVFLLAAMLWDIVSAYIAGGEDAPSLTVLIVAIVVLGGGTVFALLQSYRTWKALNAEKEKEAEEKQ